ncbi:hypothetical protein GF339_15510 [candidate division KSB3 bacterium]|uniref:Uncharacterized protein n=1 Tax=candidate division KSB3 bacterium TaxID=2044937 RepID=A0A9D5JYD6_9BACT|nr:hypothetical protein [candidate division KSB3 bacterium]MBD3325991.1 hypothetical protein [candidate division KSB3 bacterium]
MNVPVHLASGVLIGNVVLYTQNLSRPQSSRSRNTAKPTLAGFLLGIPLHILLDAFPHYNWLFSVEIFAPLPYYQIFPPLLASLPILLLAYHFAGDARLIMLSAVIGAMYPDVEKLAYLHQHLPRSLVLFRSHSCCHSHWTPWEQEYTAVVVGGEIVLLLLLIAGSSWIARKRGRYQQIRQEPALFLSNRDLTFDQEKQIFL